jgi:hypothetical protein
MLWPSVRRDILGFQPVNHTGYLAYKMGIKNLNKQLAYFGNQQIVSYSSVPENTFGGPANILPPLDGGGMLLDGTGIGDLSADLYPSKNMEIDLTGNGDLDATASLVVSLAAALTGSGTLTATIEGRLNASMDLTGSGGLTAALSGIGSMIADLTGSGDLDATIAAYGNMEIDIVVTGTGLTTANVGQAVWNYLLATGYSASEAMDILTAVAAGKVSGGPGSPVFRSIDDTRDVVTGVADSSGNRTTSTITAEG